MATKKINDLNLRSAFDATCNLPVDDAAQTWRVTGEQVKEFIKDELAPLETEGDTLYAGASGVPTALAGNTTTTAKFLKQTGTGSASAAPAWSTLSSSDIPTTLSNSTGYAIHGVATNSNAAAGDVGEYVDATLLRSSATGQTSGATTNVVSISLTAGDWDVSAMVNWRTAASTTAFNMGISTTSATLGGGDTFASSNADGNSQVTMTGMSINSSNDFCMTLPPVRVKLASTTTIYLCQSSNGAANKPNGYLSARRAR